MNCCEGPPPGDRRLPLTRRCRGIAGWILPGAILALIPKCPLCIAAYIAFATGLGVSISTATYLRLSLIGICLASIAYLAAERLSRFRMTRPAERSIARGFRS